MQEVCTQVVAKKASAFHWDFDAVITFTAVNKVSRYNYFSKELVDIINKQGDFLAIISELEQDTVKGIANQIKYFISFIPAIFLISAFFTKFITPIMNLDIFASIWSTIISFISILVFYGIFVMIYINYRYNYSIFAVKPFVVWKYYTAKEKLIIFSILAILVVALLQLILFGNVLFANIISTIYIIIFYPIIWKISENKIKELALRLMLITRNFKMNFILSKMPFS